MNLKQLFYYWCFLDIEHTCSVKETYFGKFQKEASRKNLITVHYLSAFLGGMSLIVIAAMAVLKAPASLMKTYVIIALLETVVFFISERMLKKDTINHGTNYLVAAYLFHLLIIGSIIGTFLSPDESASIYFLALLLSQMIFLLPPLFTGILSAVSTTFTIWTSFLLKSDFFFRIDLLNCIGVYVISLSVGWLVNKMKIDETLARTKVQQLNNQLKQLSSTDQLTGLPNHRNFQEVYYERFEHSQIETETLGVIMMDIDQFKAYNDNYGHVQGDECLKALGELLRNFSNEQCFICRFGGEEFVALLKGEACNKAPQVAELIRKGVENLAIEHKYSRVSPIVTVSTGLFIGIPAPGDMPMDFVDRADRAMYQSKADGGNRLTVFGALSSESSVFPSVIPKNKISDKRKVLIVDDNEINRELLCWILEDEYEPLQAQSGRDAIKILRNNPEGISAVLLDLLMPEMDGYEVIATMRKDAKLTTLPVIVTTATTASDAEVKALSLGANDFITKPYQSAVIRHRLANTINLRETAAFVNAVEKDSLTGIYNKEFFFHKIKNLLATDNSTEYDIICSDIERFKLVNELFGEDTGDSLLQSIAGYFTATIGKEGICARIGSDKFACLIPHRDDYTSAEFEAYCADINRFLPQLHIKVRFGLYCRVDKKAPPNALCDRALTAANSYKGRYDQYYALYDDAFGLKIKDEQLILNDMVHALKNNQFAVYYQPKYSLFSRKIIGAEALVRWIHPQKGIIPPNKFIPIFEKNGFILDMDKYIWEKVLSDMAEWRAEGRETLSVSVNMSRADIYDPKFTEILCNLTKKYDIPPELLHLEITESAYMHDSEQLIEVVRELKDLGFVIEMDDFGTGYSSLNMLSELPLNMLKLDIGFISKNKSDTKKNEVVSLVLQVAEKIGVDVVAEGVETSDQEENLREMGCRYAQGYHYAHPMPKEQFIRFMEEADGIDDIK